MAVEPTFYAFTYEVFDLANPDEDNYQRQISRVDVTVMAESASSAIKVVQKLAPDRGSYKLSSIVEVSDQYQSISKGSGY